MHTSTPFVLPFTDPSVRDVAIGGGKGANLATLTQAGFLVPPGGVVIPDAYRAFIAPIAAKIATLAAGLSATDHTRIDGLHHSIVEAAAALDMPTDLVAEVEAFLAAAPAGTRWAVRSSGTAEDTAAAAFAGQHDTFLNRTDAADVLEHVRRCWLSLWSPRAIAYRTKLGVRHTDIAMAVVLQQMVMSEVAGVGFSIDPVSGQLGHAVINANFGLGESVVSGEGEVDHLVVDKSTGRVLTAHVAHKSERVVAAAQGTREATVTGAAADEPALSESDVAELIALLVRDELHYRWPQDIEWSKADGRFWLLQSRPITTIPPRWTRDESAERFPNPVTPFTWDFVEAGFHRSLNHSFRLMGLPPFDGKWFARFDAYVYGNQNAVELYARGAPAPEVTSLAELEQHLPAILNRFAWIRTLPDEWHGALPGFLHAINDFEAEPLETYDLPQLWDYLERLYATGTAYFLPNIAISIGHGVLHRAVDALVRLALDSEEADRLTAALVRTETMTTRVNGELRALAETARRDPEVVRRLRDEGSRGLWNAGRNQTSEFWTACRNFLAAHGHRETDFDAMQPTWADAPWVVLDHVRALLDVAAEEPRASEPSAAELEGTVLAHVPPAAQGLAAGVLALARAYTALDDEEHYHTTRLSRPMRRGVLEIGRRLVALGLLTHVDDAFFATRESMMRLIADGSNAYGGAFVKEVARSRAEYQTAQRTPPAWELGGGGSAASVAGGASGRENGHVLTGIAGSPGSAEGLVHVVRGVEDFATFPKGGIIVARTTNPAWTPLFYSAAGVITESGGPLSHGAVTAREMKIPAVMSVRNVLATLATGDRVRVDGSRGVVERLE